MSVDFLGLRGKTAIVWGGGAGMGEDTATRLAQAGCNIAVVDMDYSRAQAVAEKLAGDGIQTYATEANATEAAQVDDAVRATENELGPIDVMATVIGIGVWSTILEMTPEQWSDSHKLNLTSFFLPARAVARSMIEGGRPGAITCVASVSGLTSAPAHAGYGAAKAGLINLVRTMALEWGQHNIRVNAIAPGGVETPRIQMGEAALNRFNEMIPLGRPGTTDDMAKAILFLLSDLASYVTGHTLPVDGGWGSTFLMHPANSVKSKTSPES